MNKFLHGKVRRTCGRNTALEQFNGRAFYRLPWREAANDAVFEVGRVG